MPDPRLILITPVAALLAYALGRRWGRDEGYALGYWIRGIELDERDAAAARVRRTRMDRVNRG